MNISIENLSLEIGDKKILTNINFDFKSGKISKVEGANGCGKTSLLNCILGIYNDYSGLVRMNDELIEPNNQLKYNRKISFLISQKAHYDQLTVSENINIFKYYYQVKEIAKELTQLYSIFGLTNFENVKASNLSEGYKKKLSMILCLINNGDSIILDEPFNFLDQESVVSLKQYFTGCTAQKKSVIFSAHQQNIFDDMEISTLSL